MPHSRGFFTAAASLSFLVAVAFAIDGVVRVAKDDADVWLPWVLAVVWVVIGAVWIARRARST